MADCLSMMMMEKYTGHKTTIFMILNPIGNSLKKQFKNNIKWVQQMRLLQKYQRGRQASASISNDSARFILYILKR